MVASQVVKSLGSGISFSFSEDFLFFFHLKFLPSWKGLKIKKPR